MNKRVAVIIVFLSLLVIAAVIAAIYFTGDHRLGASSGITRPVSSADSSVTSSSGDENMSQSPVSENPSSQDSSQSSPVTASDYDAPLSRDADFISIIGANPLDTDYTQQIKAAGGDMAKIAAVEASFAAAWEKEVDHALALAVDAADAAQVRLIQSAQETWDMYLSDNYSFLDSITSAAHKDSDAKKAATNASLRKQNRARALELYECYYILAKQSGQNPSIDYAYNG